MPRCLSYNNELHKPVKLNPPIARVVRRILNSKYPKLPIKKRTIPTKALMLKEIIIVIKKTFLTFMFSFIIGKWTMLIFKYSGKPLFF